MTKFPGGRFKNRKRLLEHQLNRMKIPKPRVGLIGVGGGGGKVVSHFSQTEETLYQRFKHFLRIDIGRAEFPEDLIQIEIGKNEMLEDRAKERLEAFAWDHDLIIVCSIIGGHTSRALLPQVCNELKTNEWAKVMALLVLPSKQEKTEVLNNAKHTKDELMGDVDLIFQMENSSLQNQSRQEDTPQFYLEGNASLRDLLRCFVQNSKEKLSLWNFGPSIKDFKGSYKIHTHFDGFGKLQEICVKKINDIVAWKLKEHSENGRIFGIIIALEVPDSFSVLKVSRLISDLRHNFDEDSLIRLTISHNSEWNDGCRFQMCFLQEA